MVSKCFYGKSWCSGGLRIGVDLCSGCSWRRSEGSAVTFVVDIATTPEAYKSVAEGVQKAMGRTPCDKCNGTTLITVQDGSDAMVACECVASDPRQLNGPCDLCGLGAPALRMVNGRRVPRHDTCEAAVDRAKGLSAGGWSIAKTSCHCNREDNGHGWAVLFENRMVQCLGCLRDNALKPEQTREPAAVLIAKGWINEGKDRWHHPGFDDDCTHSFETAWAEQDNTGPRTPEARPPRDANGECVVCRGHRCICDEPRMRDGHIPCVRCVGGTHGKCVDKDCPCDCIGVLRAHVGLRPDKATPEVEHHGIRMWCRCEACTSIRQDMADANRWRGQRAAKASPTPQADAAHATWPADVCRSCASPGGTHFYDCPTKPREAKTLSFDVRDRAVRWLEANRIPWKGDGGRIRDALEALIRTVFTEGGVSDIERHFRNGYVSGFSDGDEDRDWFCNEAVGAYLATQAKPGQGGS